MSVALADVLGRLGSIVLGKERELRLAFCCLLARGHLLIEDIPGVGKTTLAHALARVFGLDFRRVQFTSDLLPADVLGQCHLRSQLAGIRLSSRSDFRADGAGR